MQETSQKTRPLTHTALKQLIRDVLPSIKRVSNKFGHNDSGVPSDWTEWQELRESIAKLEKAVDDRKFNRWYFYEGPDENGKYGVMISWTEEEILMNWKPTWKLLMEKKFGAGFFENSTDQDCIDDFVTVHYAWKI